MLKTYEVEMTVTVVASSEDAAWTLAAENVIVRPAFEDRIDVHEPLEDSVRLAHEQAA